jgi:3-methyl-2-oxobutanoate hydroxymethyltransferase
MLGSWLVIYDALGVTAGGPRRFVRNFMTGHDSIEAALSVRGRGEDGSFPAAEHCF